MQGARRRLGWRRRREVAGARAWPRYASAHRGGARPAAARPRGRPAARRPRRRPRASSPAAAARAARPRAGSTVERARLRRAHHPAVARLQPAARAQAVAVEHRAGQLAVAERDRRRAVPRLHQQRVEVGRSRARPRQISSRPCCASGTISLSACGTERPATHQQLEHRVDRGRVRRLRIDGRQHGGELVAEQVGGELTLARPHPVAVAGERVDLAVVGDQPVRVGQRPARERVGREARVQQRERRGAALVA